MNFKTEQENFWASEFGTEYIKRNSDEKTISSNVALFSRIFNRTVNLNSILELGANIGLNLHAIRSLLPQARLTALEINNEAAEILAKNDWIDVKQGSIIDFQFSEKYDLVFTKGVLIHLDPSELPHVYEKIYAASSRYILIAEYYNPVPVSIEYRGFSDKLFKRDFAGELLDKYHDLSLVDYGFVYRRDPVFPQDDVTWFLLKRNSENS